MDDFESTEFMKNIKNACNAAKDQAGCRMLQRWLDKKDPFILTLIFEQVLFIINKMLFFFRSLIDFLNLLSTHLEIIYVKK